ncbi:MAG: hypothetical protein AAF560_08455 [Acidobacteriota bacterium]
MWILSAHVEGFWAEEVRLEAEVASVELILLPAGRVAGRVSFPTGVQTPGQLKVTLQEVPLASRSTGDPVPKSSFGCSADTAFDCSVRAGELDLRIEAEGFAPRYFWGVSILEGQTLDLGQIEFEKGASLTGWVETATAGPAESGAVVELQRHFAAQLMPQAEQLRIAAKQLEASVTERGFFQLTGIEPGGYLLSASKPGHASEQLFIEIEAELENRLEEPVFLDLLAGIEVFLTPPVDSYGAPWLISLLEQAEQSSVLNPVAENEPVSLQGFWEQHDLSSGKYQLAISDTRGSKWLNRPIEIYAGNPAVFLEIPLVEILGRVTMGDEPLQAVLSFGTTQGEREIRFEADAEGVFSGYLPNEGLWPVELVSESPSQAQALEPVEVRMRPGKRVVDLEILLPDTLLEGEVLYDGEPAPGAFVVMMRQGEEKTRRETMLETDERGEFSLLGVSPGRVLAHAYQRRRKSAWVEVLVSEDLEAPRLQLELRDQLEVSGAVLSAGRPVPGAAVFGNPNVSGEPFRFTSQAATDLEGNFTLQVASSTSSVDLLVVPSGFAIQMFRVPLQTDASRPLLIDVTSDAGTLFLSFQTQNSDGRMLRHRGANFDIKLLYSLLAATGRLQANSEGFGLIDLAPGDYELCRAQTCDLGYLGASSELVLGRDSADASRAREP